jgi:hypothetical protein
LRVKLTLIVGAATIALLAVIVGGALSGLRQAEELAVVEGRLIPRLRVGPEMQTDFERLRQEMRDAVAAQDLPALESSVAQRDRLLLLLSQSAPMLNPADADALRRALQEYWDSAYPISRRLIAGETGDQIVADIADMQARDRHATEVLERTIAVREPELKASFAAIRQAAGDADRFRLIMGVGGLLLVGLFSVWLARGILRSLTSLSHGFARFATGKFDETIPVNKQDELGDVASDANQMADSLKKLAQQRDRNDWLKLAQMGLSDQLRDDTAPAELARRALWFLCKHIGAGRGALYLNQGQDALRLVSEFAGGAPDAAGLDAEPAQALTDAAGARVIRLGQGLVGQAALSDELLSVEDLPADFSKIWCGLGAAPSACLVLVPLKHLKQRVGLIEFGLLRACPEHVRELLSAISEPLALALSVADSRAHQTDLLAKTREQAARLSLQEEELRARNRELMLQQAELQHANEELELQRGTLSQRNVELEETRNRVQQKAEELARVSSYKSQFLANMSHELRTPLNSMLLLSGLLAENAQGNLLSKQIEHAKTVHAAGKDLLALINQILDLAKIEAGKQEVELESVSLSALLTHARGVFAPLAAQKRLQFVTLLAPTLQDAFTTDRHRVQRILANLLGNAIKFTDQGSVTLEILEPAAASIPANGASESAGESPHWVAFRVTDTGPGIEPNAQERIFAPFEQAESTSSRRHAGTGLGLAIARESAGLLGGDLTLESKLGSGSTFTCVLPDLVAHQKPATAPAAEPAALRDQLIDDRASLAGSDESLLVIEDDLAFGEQLRDLIRERGLRFLLATMGEEGLRMAREHQPRGIILDVGLPDVDGWTVMEHLKHDPVTRNIPVHFVSATDAPQRGLALGAVGYLVKPAGRAELIALVQAITSNTAQSIHRVLVVEDDVNQGESLVDLLSGMVAEVEHVVTAAAAIAALARNPVDCIILDLGLPDMDGLALLEALSSRSDLRRPRIVVHTGRTLTKAEHRRLEQYAEAVIQKDGSSDAKVLDELRAFVARVEHQPVVNSSRTHESSSANSLSGVRLLLTDDDMRTVYAVSALLRSWGADVFVAATGLEALNVLERQPHIDMVLMDVMMPEMGGYETMRRIRQDARFAHLPIFALTASALKGERERCLDAGASEYLPKPLDSSQLLQLLQTWRQPKGSAA